MRGSQSTERIATRNSHAVDDRNPTGPPKKPRSKPSERRMNSVAAGRDSPQTAGVGLRARRRPWGVLAGPPLNDALARILRQMCWTWRSFITNTSEVSTSCATSPSSCWMYLVVTPFSYMSLSLARSSSASALSRCSVSPRGRVPEMAIVSIPSCEIRNKGSGLHPRNADPRSGSRQKMYPWCVRSFKSKSSGSISDGNCTK
mmetsp:Transcript_6404/g.14925  ORF Transcript_6404/g.14925 Transcript_6404/m.14925 type:complete len:202 (-) Transcript_6404:853-1458(-)